MVEQRILEAGALNMARMWEAPARSIGGRWARWDDAWAADSGLPTRVFNRVTILRRLNSSAAPELAERINKFYGVNPNGGEYLVNDPWATLRLEPHGFERWWSLPFMFRPAGGAPSQISDLEIRKVRSGRDLEAFVHTLVEGFAIAELENLPASSIMNKKVLDDGAMQCWVGIAEGRAIGTSVAYLSDGVVGVYLISVVPAMRRHGFGETLTWKATLADHTAPSTLQSSELGRPVYERMGYITALECATWLKASRTPAL
ncbi:MAG TPA: GNAT family N-acetyltransferase [Candidatus Dormibacteraeota bacterium]